MARIMKINAKCSDLFYATFEVDKEQVGEDYDGYVPDFFPGKHFGDYVQLDIDIDTGNIVNWKKPTDEDIDNLFGVEDELK